MQDGASFLRTLAEINTIDLVPSMDIREALKQQKNRANIRMLTMGIRTDVHRKGTTPKLSRLIIWLGNGPMVSSKL